MFEAVDSMFESTAIAENLVLMEHPDKEGFNVGPHSAAIIFFSISYQHKI